MEALSIQPQAEMVTDPLTGLANQAAFDQQLEALLKRKPAKGKAPEPVSLGLMDIDWFGRFNEAHGREVGDRLLAALGSRIRQLAEELGGVYRYGGDAFALLMPGVEKEVAFLRLEQLRVSLAVPLGEWPESEGLPAAEQLSVSMGLAALPEDGDQLRHLERRMSEAIYRAKNSGRDRICLAREEKMITKTSHYTQGQLEGLTRLAKRKSVSEATLLREALDDLLRKHNA